MKTFCFEFYPGEALRQSQFLNLRQKGVYFQIITAHLDMEQFSYDFLMNIMCELNDAEKKQMFSLFLKIDDENYVLEWVKNSIDKRISYLKSRSNNKLNKTKKPKNISKSYDNHMVDVYVDVNKDIIVKEKEGVGEKTKSEKKRKPDSITEVVQIFKSYGLNGKSEAEAEDFMDWYTNANWTQGKAKTPLVDWTSAARRWAKTKLLEDKSKNVRTNSGQKIVYPSTSKS